jgi:hypothetical protein
MTKTAFISGPIDVNDEYFTEYYESPILAAIEEGHSFVLGPVYGVDTKALNFLLEQDVDPSRISIYMAGFEYNNIQKRRRYTSLGVNVVKAQSASTTALRDAAMTAVSDYDILRYRTEAESKEVYGPTWHSKVSDAQMNERRRLAAKEGGNSVKKNMSNGSSSGVASAKKHAGDGPDGPDGHKCIVQ